METIKYTHYKTIINNMYIFRNIKNIKNISFFNKVYILFLFKSLFIIFSV